MKNIEEKIEKYLGEASTVSKARVELNEEAFEDISELIKSIEKQAEEQDVDMDINPFTDFFPDKLGKTEHLIMFWHENAKGGRRVYGISPQGKLKGKNVKKEELVELEEKGSGTVEAELDELGEYIESQKTIVDKFAKKHGLY